jgi:hypothetical protein
MSPIGSVWVLVALVIIRSASANEADASNSGTEEIVIGDEVRTAFYEHAPRSLAAAMSRAVDSWCSSANRIPDGHEAKAETVSWLCGPVWTTAAELLSQRLRHWDNGLSRTGLRK